MRMARALLVAFSFVILAMAGGSARAAELVMVERHGCPWCDRWNAEVAPAYSKSEEGQRAPLRRVSLDDGQPKLALKEPVRFTPTFILVEQGREIGRITGYLENGMFWGLLGVLLKRIDQPSERSNP